MIIKTDIQTLDDVKTMVNDFYGNVREDDLLGTIFDRVIQDRWPEHLEKMYRFWETVLLNNHTYNGSPFPPHAKLPVKQKHFERWKQLFFETVDNHFSGSRADEAKWRASKMAEMFWFKIDYLQNQ